jgi:hypothetical protein
MAQKFRARSHDLTRLDESELTRFNAYYSRFVKVGSRPLTLEEAELVLGLMTVEQRWGLIIALEKQEWTV